MSRWIRIALAAVLAAGLVAAAGCGGSSSTLDLKEGEPFTLGDLNYNVLFTRFLNPAQVEDASYVTGQPPPPAGMRYLATFLLVKNKGHDPITLPTRDELTVTDTTHAEYAPLPSSSLFSFPYGSALGPGDVVPKPDSVAAGGPTQGSMLLYLLPEGVTENRPLVLDVKSQGKTVASIQLDL